MTFSIVAHDPSEETWGIAVASKFPAVGAVVPWARAGWGALASQASANTSFGPTGLNLMGNAGLGALAALDKMLADDPQRESRQVGLVDSQGGSATFTGAECFDWAGGLIGAGYAIQGNILAGPQVVAAMQSAFLGTQASLDGRLYAALLAGDRAGGDRRGRQSAAILVVKAQGGYGGFNDRLIDYRVDDDSDPVARLGDLLELHRLYFGKSPESERVALSGETLLKIQAVLQRLGYLEQELSGEYDKPTQAAFSALIGNENFEERCDPEQGWLDRPVLDFILRKFGA
ncbi:MAG: DUF1028 domain-containing protein [Anaerolineales bacterium]|jgi:uncharacterized Ntn-hydrolase superfamily protein|nr:DUF1028 domain-containing protein [Anaerolineales bacterium]